MKFDLEKLNQIPIADVIEKLGAVPNNSSKGYHCFRKNEHANNDAKASMMVYKNSNTCKCFACEISGGPVNIAKIAFDGNFKTACEWLHSNFNVPYLDGSQSQPTLKKAINTLLKKNEIQYVYFDKDKLYRKVDKFSSYLNAYNSMNKTQKLKSVYTFIYNFSLLGDQKPKNLYYQNRGIKTQKDIDDIGFLSYEAIKNLEKMLLLYFPMNDLIEFKIFNEKRHVWNYPFNVAIIPCFDLYSNIVTNFSIRAIDSTYKGVKEFNISCSNIVIPNPYGFDNNKFRKCQKVVLCEGHIDLLSAKTFYKQDDSTVYLTFGGVFNHREELLTIFKDKKVFICFDKDEAGLKGEKAISKKLNALNISNTTLTWDIAYGKDLNDLLVAKKMHTIKISEN